MDELTIDMTKIPPDARPAVEVLLQTDPESVESGAQHLLRDERSSVRCAALQVLGHRVPAEGCLAIGAHLHDSDATVQQAARDALTALATRLVPERDNAVARCESDHWRARQRAVYTLGLLAHEEDVKHVQARFQDTDEDVRLGAFLAALMIAPQRQTEWIEAFLDDDDEDVAEAVLRAIKHASLPDFDPVDFALDKIPSVRGVIGAQLLELVRELRPDRFADALRRAVGGRGVPARAEAARLLGENELDQRVDMLQRLAREGAAEVKVAALNSLIKIAPKAARSVALPALHSRDEEARAAGLRVLAACPDPELIDEVLPLARDAAWEVRLDALDALAPLDDIRVLSELVSARNDVDNDVRSRARALLESGPERVPVLARFADQPGGVPVWERLLTRVQEINRWASATGQELLGVPVRVVQYREGLGRTGRGGRNRRAVQIEVSDSPVTTGQPHGVDIMRGLALHEIGHHLCDFGVRGASTTRGIARSEGVGEIYDILCDERLERVLRSRRPEWGVYFDRLASYAFAQNVHHVELEEYARLMQRKPETVLRQIEAGRLPGRPVRRRRGDESQRIALRDSDWLAVPGLVPRLAAFLVCLRCGFDPTICPDPKIARAVRVVPGNLKDLPHGDVLELSRKIAGIIGNAPEHRREMQRLRRQLRHQRRLLRGLRRALNRLSATNPGPIGADDHGAPGIRTNPTPPAPRTPGLPKRPGGPALNLGSELDFPPLEHTEKLEYDPAAHRALVGKIRRHIRQLRAYFERLGRRSIEERASRRGRRLDVVQARQVVYRPTPNLLVHEREDVYANAYLGLLIDRSGSMHGEKLELARSFGALVAESARGIRGLDGHVNAFDDDTFYELGGFERNAIAALTSGGGNNDAGALQRAAELAQRSGKRNRLIIMVSDGMPAECTAESVRGLVQCLVRSNGIVCAHAAIAPLPEVLFPHFIDLSQYQFHEAVACFGRLIMSLTRTWR